MSEITQYVTYGIQEINFTNDRGEVIQGAKIYVGFRDENVVGQRCETVFIRKGFPIPKELVPGAVIELSFDIKKRLDGIRVISTPSK